MNQKLKLAILKHGTWDESNYSTRILKIKKCKLKKMNQKLRLINFF